MNREQRIYLRQLENIAIAAERYRMARWWNPARRQLGLQLEEALNAICKGEAHEVVADGDS